MDTQVPEKKHGTGIRWTHGEGRKGETWNPVIGCSKVSPGCAHCYAEQLSKSPKMARFGYTGLDWTPANAHLNVQLRPDRLQLPLRWSKPRMVFVNSMSDLFHELVPDAFIEAVFGVMSLAGSHIFQVLTKRPERMREFVQKTSLDRCLAELTASKDFDQQAISTALRRNGDLVNVSVWPLPNVWLGTSVENQHWADKRIPQLLETPAAIRFLSCEPLLGAIALTRAVPPPDHDSDVWDDVNDVWDHNTEPEMHVEECEAENDWINFGNDLVLNPEWRAWTEERETFARRVRLAQEIHWVIVGGESGPKFRKMDLDWARSLRDQCQDAGVAFFYKQSGGARSETGQLLDGVRWEQMPEGVQR